MMAGSKPLKYAGLINRCVLAETTPPDFHFRYIDIGSVDAAGFVDVPDDMLTFDSAPSRARRVAAIGATIISTVRTYLRAIARVPASDLPLVFSTGFATVEATGDADARYLYYACRSGAFVDEVVARSSGVAYPAINPSELGSISIPWWAPDVQRRIADFLDDQVARIDNIIAARQQQIDLVRGAAVSNINQLFSAGCLAEPCTRLGRFILAIEQGWSPQCDAYPASEGEWGVLKVSAVKDGVFIPQENKHLPDDVEPARSYEIHDNDLLATRANTPSLVGAFAVVPPGTRRKLILCDKIFRLRLAPELDPQYVAFVARTADARAQLSGAGTGTSQSMVNIRGDDIRSLRIPIRSIHEQRSLIAVAKAFEHNARRISEALAAQLELLRELKQSLITAAVTGKLDVASADGSRVPV